VEPGSKLYNNDCLIIENSKRMDGMKKFFFTLLLYGGGIIVLGFVAGYPIIGILIALFVSVSLYMSLIYGQIVGAEFALRNPPPPGETRIAIKVFEQEISMSDNFIFLPPASDGQQHNFIINKGGRPKGSLSSAELTRGTTVEDILPFLREAKEAREKQDGSFTKLCKSNNHPESTVRDWLERYSDKL
jgi:hypothetical protein